MAEIKLIGLAASRAVRVIWMLHELGLPFEHDPVGFADGKAKLAPYTQLRLIRRRMPNRFGDAAAE